MKTLPTDYSHQQLVDALQAEFIQLMHDVAPTDDDFTLDEHLDYLNAMSYDELVVETGTNDGILELKGTVTNMNQRLS